MSSRNKIKFLIASAILLFSYSNCGKMNSQSAALSGTNLSSQAPSPNSPTPVTPRPTPTPTPQTPPTPTPVPTPQPPTPTPSPSGYGTQASNCMSNGAYDACLFWKNPVAQRNSPFSQILRAGTDLSADQTYGVKLLNRLDQNTLRSNTINVLATNGSTPPLVNGQLRRAYAQDAGKAWTAQLMAYFWLTTLESEFIKRIGKFYAASQNVIVDAYSTVDSSTATVKGNASYSKTVNTITMGYALAEDKNTIAHEMALSSEVYIHEMGHANLRFGTSSNLSLDLTTKCVVISAAGDVITKACNQIYTNDTFAAKICPDMYGCPSAINEGQADFHVFMIFPNNPGFFETISNKIVETSPIPRNPVLTKNITASEMYSKSRYSVKGTIIQGEVHDLGSLYASILYALYMNTGMNKQHFEKLFNEHLKLIQNDDTFVDCLQNFRSLANSLKNEFGRDYTSIINAEFSKRGIN